MDNIYYYKSDDKMSETPVDNIFITEYMPQARGDYVKVYLTGLMSARGGGMCLSTEEVASQLGLTQSDVIAAWNYWEKQGIIGIGSKGGATAITFYHIPSLLLGGIKADTRVSTPKPATEDERHLAEMFVTLEKLYGSRGMPKRDRRTIAAWIREDGLSPEAVVILVDYVFARIAAKGTQFNPVQVLSYMEKVEKAWKGKDIRTAEQAVSYIEARKLFSKRIRHVMRAIGQERSAMAHEREMIEKWYGTYDDEAIIDFAISRSDRSSIRYIDGIIAKWIDAGLRTLTDIKQWEENRRESYKRNQPATNKGSLPVDQSRLDVYAAMAGEDEAWLMAQQFEGEDA